MEDIIPLRSRIYAILRSCNFEETKQVLEFCKQLKPSLSSSTSRSNAAKQIITEQEQPRKELTVNVDYLCGKWMHCVGQVAQWTYDTYFKGKRPESYDKVLAATKICYAAMLPIRLIAADGPECVGSMSIVKHEQPDHNFTPLITFICVPNNYKLMGIEQQLIKQGIRVLKGLGYKEAFIKTEKTSILPSDMRWEPVPGCQDIYKHTIQNTTPIY